MEPERIDPWEQVREAEMENKRITFKEMLAKMEEDTSYRDVDYGELARQLKSWPKCTVCGSPFIPSRSTKDGICGNVAVHIKLQREDRMQITTPRCTFCGRIVPENPNAEGRGRPRKYCSNSCKTQACSENRKLKGIDGQGLLNSSQNAKEGVKVESRGF